MAHFGFPLETVIIFFAVIAFSVYLDLYAHRNTTEITVKDATKWSVFWIGLAVLFYFYLMFRFEKSYADLYLAGYVLEKSLSIDNLIVFMAIFASFSITGKLQHRILYWGILGALVFRAIFVVIGVSLFEAAPYVGFFFAAFVGWSGYKMLTTKESDEEEQEDYSQHWSVKLVGKLMPVYPKLVDHLFVVNQDDLEKRGLALPPELKKAAWYATPAFLCLMAIETSDVAFAFDSVPAVIAITSEPLLVYAAMIFAILGLRSLYFILAALTRYLVHLEKAVISLLFFIAFKMTIESWNKLDYPDLPIHISPNVSLWIVLLTLAAGVAASYIFPAKDESPNHSE